MPSTSKYQSTINIQITVAKSASRVQHAYLVTWLCLMFQYDGDETADTILIPSDDGLEKMSWQDLHFFYHRYITTFQILCRKQVRVGHLVDGGWEICEDDAYIPKKPCLVYSVGIANDFSFDDEIVERYGCDVHSFDPTINQKDHLRGTQIHFHPIGLASRTGEESIGPVMTLEDIRTKFGHTNRPIDILKIDIEKMEWVVLPQMLKKGTLHDVRQIVMELHIRMVYSFPKERYTNFLVVLRQLYEAGYRIFQAKQNIYTVEKNKLGMAPFSRCQEVSFIKIV
ncbi:hypothetical protein ScPMuIL_011109 [Solemya velum]